jgi:hypothetical protein
MSLAICEISLSSANVSNNQSLISNRDNSLLFSGVDRYDFDNDVYAKNVKLANENDIQNLQIEIDNILPLSNYAYINGNDETSQLGGIPFGTGSINTLIQSPDFLYDNVNKVVKVDNINLATQTQIDTLQTEIDNITPNPNVWINSDGITSTAQQIPFTDGSPNGMKTDPDLTFSIQSGNPSLNVGGVQMVSLNNNMVLTTADYILSQQNLTLQGTADVQRYLSIGNINQPNYVKTSVDKTTGDYICDNQIGSKTQWKGASEYDFDNNVKIGDNTTTKKLYLNNVEIKPPVQNLSNYYVSPSGSNASGNGSITNPWGTIGYAVSVLNAIVGDITSTIHVASGNYSESDIIVTKSGVSIIGANSISTIFTGDIYFTMAVSSLFYSVGQLANISVYGCIYHNNPHIYSNSFSISGIISAPPNGKSNVIMSSSGGGLGSDCTINNNSILYANSDTTPIILNQNSSLTGVGFQISNNPTLSFTLQNYIRVLDSARCNLFACSLINASNNANAAALININNTNNVTSSTTINNCQLLFTNGVASTTAAIINFTNTASSNTVNYYGNFSRSFLTQNAPNNYLILKSGGGAVNFSQGSNIARQGGHNIPATGAFTGWTKTNFQAVV